MNYRHGWKNITIEDATEDEMELIHKIFGPKPDWMSDENWRENMKACAKDIRDYVEKSLSPAE